MSDEIKNPNTEEEYQPDLMTLVVQRVDHLKGNLVAVLVLKGHQVRLLWNTPKTKRT